jgi:Mor family transcriptional regulator
MVARWIADVPADEIMAAVPGRVAEIMEAIGVEATLRLIEEYQGQQLYVPKLDGIFKRLRDRRIRDEFTGANHAALAKRYNLSVSAVYAILAEPDRQPNMFEEG